MVGWTLVDRDELPRLTDAVLGKRGAVITGPAGVGKTILAAVCLRQAQKQGMSVARVTATRASRGLPFGALGWILPPDPRGTDLSREDHGDLLRRYGRAVIARAGGRPLVVFVDDAHLLDNGSATLVHQLALTRAATVLATVRSGEAAPDPVLSLWKDGPAERIEMGVLGDAELNELLVTVLGGPVDEASVRQLLDHCQGNLMYLRELVWGALETGALAAEDGFWSLRGPLRPTARLVELVALRLGALSGPERATLELLTLGEPLGQAELSQLADPAAVEALERRGLITSRMHGRRVQVLLAHPLYGDVVRVGISVLRERALARARAELIEAAGSRRREDTLLVASLRLAGGGGSAELLASGATVARARHDHLLAERLARAAIAEGAGFEARFVAAEAAHLQGRRDQAENELAALAADATSDADRARVALVRFDNAFFLQGRADFRLLDDAANSITDPFWLDQLLAGRLNVMAVTSGPRAIVEAGSALIQRPASSPLTAVHLVVYGMVRLGRLDAAIRLVSPHSARGAVPAADEGWGPWTLFADRADALILAGRLGEAEELLSTAYDQVVGTAAEARATVTHRLAVLHLEQGRMQSAFRRASESYTLYQQLGRTLVARLGYITAAQALAMTGRANQAAQTLAALDALDLPAVLLDQADLLQARAWTVAAAGDLPAARAQLEKAADLGEQVGDVIGAVGALHGLARLGRARQVASRLTALAGEIDGELAVARAAYASAIAARDSQAIKKVSQDFEDLGTLLYAADARAEAAAVLRDGGRDRNAVAEERKAAQLLARCEGADTPMIRIHTRARLTPGELDTALQAAAGRSNRQIADDQHLSIRTIENHLHRVYEKLGISGRHELANAMSDQPIADPLKP